MPRIIAKIISGVLHPLIMPTVGVLLMFTYPTYLTALSYEIKKAIVLIVFLSTFLAPMLIFLLFYNMRIISDLSMSTRKERPLPYMVLLVFYIGTIWLFLTFSSPVPRFVMLFLFLGGGGLIAQFVANFWIKASAHTSGISGMVTYIVFFLYINNLETAYFVVISALCIGLVGTARLQLNAHTPKEVLVGTLTGMFFGALPFLMFW